MEPMSRGLDHIVHAVCDLDRAGELYERLGFTFGARNRHPWGTHNPIIQFPGVFIELVMFAEPDKLGADGFSVLFAARNRDFAAAHDGLSMLILESRDAADDGQQFRHADIFPAFEREGQRPDGSRVKVGFSLAFAADSAENFLEPKLPAASERRARRIEHHHRRRRSGGASGHVARLQRCG
jgi:hypothetical protein